VAWRRGQQRRALMLVSQPNAVARTLVLPHATPAVYCLPGRRGIIVLTSAATAILDDHQLHAVLDHERAHLRHRHDLILTAAAALRAAFPFIHAFTAAQTQLQRLVEMHADDVATRCHDRKTFATALVALVEGGIPSTAIGAGGSGAVARVQRLIRPANPLQLRWLALGFGAATSLLTLPLIIALAPAVVSALLNYCPIGFPPAAR
jgi:hypothetical protein